MNRVTLPFAAIVGQDKLKLALLLNAINPPLLGVLIRGEKGTGKSTAVRALAELLPEIEVVKCPFQCSPQDAALQCESCSAKRDAGQTLPTYRRRTQVVELPLGATEDRVTGSLDIEKALREGTKALEPGILADVNQGILYIDEVNLLDDHLVDVLLDAAAMGVNIVEREGISVSHPSRFILVGTMNPEEGEIRPQLLDRFGLSVNVEATREREERTQIIKVVEEFENDPDSVTRRHDKEQDALRKRILKARDMLGEVEIADRLLDTVADICTEFGVQGHRADFLMARAAKTMAAFNGRREVGEDDLRVAAELVLPHRMRRMPFEEPQPVAERVGGVIRRRQATGGASGDTSHSSTAAEASDDGEPHTGSSGAGITSKPIHPRQVPQAVDIRLRKDNRRRMGSERRAPTLSTHSGKYVKAGIPADPTTDIAIDATIRAAALRTGSLKIGTQDLREKIRAKKVSSVIVFVVDASGSMATMRGMELARQCVMTLLEDAYRKRDKVAFVAVAGERASVLLPPTSSVELAAKCLRDLPAEGRTPLADGMYKGMQLLQTQLWKNKDVIPIMVLVSDGRGNVPIADNARKEAIALAKDMKRRRFHLIAIDTDDDLLCLGYNADIVEASGGRLYRLDETDAWSLAEVLSDLSTFGSLAV
jgi:magnesium chelatase subunit D